jgi:gamma-glutamyl phosphate reductase
MSSSTATTWSFFGGRKFTYYACEMTHDGLAAQGRAVREAATALGQASDDQRRAVLAHVADRLDETCDELLAINADEVAAYDESGAGRDRLTLTPARIAAMASALREIADNDDPLFEVVDASVRPNGLAIERLRVPLGVIGVVYENRPNVTSDVAGLCVRSGNAAYLRGSSTALKTNQFIVSLWHEALEKEGLPADGVSLVEDTSHDTATAFMQMTDVLDCLIPRGGPSLIAAMREHARVPYVLDGDGNCHIFVDATADVESAVAIVRNAKTSRPGVCNAAETVLVHADIAAAFLPGARSRDPRGRATRRRSRRERAARECRRRRATRTTNASSSTSSWRSRSCPRWTRRSRTSRATARDTAKRFSRPTRRTPTRGCAASTRRRCS